jgi:NO-binding membrane sensor protein with MHYT domain
MLVNLVTLVWFFWQKYGRAFWLIRVFGSGIVAALVLGVEFAALSVLFEVEVLEEFISINKTNNPIANAISGIAMIAVCSLAAATFWYDWQINIQSFNLDKGDLDYQILAVVLVLISELFFWIAKVCQVSANRSSTTNSTSRRNSSSRPPAPRE